MGTQPESTAGDDERSPATSETHISLLFFGPDRVFKLLKPIRTDFLDHSRVDRRIAAVTAEYELNRRIAPDVYLGTSDLYEQGEVVDRVLTMRRLPSARRLARLVDRPEFVDHLRHIAHQVATFHAAAPAIHDRRPMTTAPGLLGLWESSFHEIARSVGTVIDADKFDRVRLLAHEYLDHADALFDDRRERGLMRDGHGDLTADDIFMMDDGPRILDCLAFDDDYRISDVLADIAFLVMDVERLAGPEPARQLLRFYCELVDEHHPSSLAHHYVAYRAHVRAKVALLRHRQGDEASGDVAVRRHHQALNHLERARRRMVLVGGGPGTGKSTLAHGLADRFNWSVIDSDTLRKDLRGVDHDDHDIVRHPDLYRERVTLETYRGLVAQAQTLLDAGESVIIDATWSDAYYRTLAHDLAGASGTELIELECVTHPDVARARIANRRDTARDPSDATPDLVDRMASQRHTWPSARRLDADRPIDEVLDVASRIVAEHAGFHS